ncbi:hypothetical protein GVAV_003084 [Gurleya vavrai]
MSQFIKCAYGQLLSIFIAISIVSQYHLTENAAKYCFFLLYSTVYISIFIFSQFYVIYDAPVPKKKIKFYKYFACGVFDFLGGFFLNKSFSSTSAYLIILLTQLIYPMSVGIEILYLKMGVFNFKKILAFVVLATACFVVNFQQDNNDFCISFQGILYAILSDLCYMSNTFLQSFIVPHSGSSLYLRNFSVCGFLSGLIFTVIFDRKYFDFTKIVFFFIDYYRPLIFYCISLSSFYLSASLYINKYGGIVFNSSIITGSVYFGLYAMYLNGFDIIIFICFLICIVADLIIVCIEKKVINADNEIVEN